MWLMPEIGSEKLEKGSERRETRQKRLLEEGGENALR
jgi:hypothetical protein